MIAYKVFRRRESGLFSWSTDIPTSFRKRYRQNVYNRPKIGKFFVFGLLDDAKSFLRSCGNGQLVLELWEIEVPNLKEVLKIAHWHTSAENFIRFWNGQTILDTNTPPFGSYTTSALKLVKRII